MIQRGVTRPMSDHDQHAQAGDGNGHGDHGAPYSSQRYEMLRAHHRQTLWVYWTLIMLGVWTALAPTSFGYLNPATWVDPAGGRGVWWSAGTHTALRAWLMTWSDVLSGLALVALGWRALTPDRPVSLWLACGVGAWLNLAPIVFWAPSAAAYANDTLVGMLVIALTILIPGMPNMPLFMRMGEAQPPGWSYNPSGWAQRWIMIATGFLGLLASRQVAMFQLGYLQAPFEPFFGAGSRLVLTSDLSRNLPISDGALGAFAYTFEFLMGFMGSPARWRTMPWMVTLFGILVIPLGLVHIVLVISQPVVVGQWCTCCLLAAAIMLPMIPLEVDEVVAMGQHLRRAVGRGEPFWRVFWLGGDPEGSQPDRRSPDLALFPRQPGRVLRAGFWGLSAPWSLVVAALLGAGLMATPGLLHVPRPASAIFHLGGALSLVTAVICMGEVLRPGRLLNVALGLLLAIGPWVAGADLAAALTGTLAGAAIALLALPRGAIRERYGSWPVGAPG